MKRDKTDPAIVELDEAEAVVHEWYMSLLDAGWSNAEAAERILTSARVDGPTWEALDNQEFRDWLCWTPRTQPKDKKEGAK